MTMGFPPWRRGRHTKCKQSVEGKSRALISINPKTGATPCPTDHDAHNGLTQIKKNRCAAATVAKRYAVA
jgi:hypothetical protein